MAKSVKAQRESFDSALKRIVAAPALKSSAIKVFPKKPAKIIEPAL
jgi:hypothetical protein